MLIEGAGRLIVLLLLSRSPDLPITRFYRAFRGEYRAHQMFVRVTHDPSDAFQTSNLLRSALRVAACHQDAALGIAAMDAAHELADFRVSRGRDGAGVEDGDLALLNRADFSEPGLEQLLLQSGAIGLAGAAAEIENVKSSHAQGEIVAEMRTGHQPIGANQGGEIPPEYSWRPSLSSAEMR